ncbi:MAG: TetR family transcriptional regulator [Hyphomicrobiaceae bacterium]
MFDDTTPKGRIIAATMRLANDRGWQNVSLRDVAAEAGLSLGEVRGEVSSKGHVFALFTSTVDRAVLAQTGARDPNQSPRDNLFEAIMNRFDVMEPYKPAIKSFVETAAPDPRMAQRLLSSQSWMLEAAGISSDGPTGGMKTIGLLTVYIEVVKVWLEDDDPGLSRTMAVLDRRLRRGERSLRAFSDGWDALSRFASLFRRRKRNPYATTETDAFTQTDASSTDDTSIDQGEGTAPPTDTTDASDGSYPQFGA